MTVLLSFLLLAGIAALAWLQLQMVNLHDAFRNALEANTRMVRELIEHVGRLSTANAELRARITQLEQHTPRRVER